MTETGYARVTLTSGNRERHESHTSPLGCTATAIESYHLAPGAEATLPCEPEQVCVPILPAADTGDGTASTTAWAVHLGSESLPRTGVGRVPAGVETTLGVSSDTSTRAERASETATGVTVLVNYPTLLALTRSLREGLPASATRFAGTGPTGSAVSTGVDSECPTPTEWW